MEEQEVFEDSNILRPLSFPEVQENASAQANADADDTAISCLTCFLCSLTFDVLVEKSKFLKHLQTVHNLVIADVNLICDFKRYVEFWKKRFAVEPYTHLCTLVKPESASSPRNEAQYYLLSDVSAEDKKLREELQLQRLDSVLKTQQHEREDSSFSRGCLFCREHFEGNRAVLFNHMAFDHHFSVGQPNNIVFANEFLDILEQKLSNLKCLYCDKTFKDRPTLMEHMRKKMHKRINPKNAIYDKFYIINYLEMGKNWEAVLSEDEEERQGHGRNQDFTDQDDNWEDWQEDAGIGAVCLFCTVNADDIKTLGSHMASVHGFDLEHMKQGLDFYLQVKLINYIRRRVHLKSCIACQEKFTTREAMLDHMTSQGHMTQLPNRKDWDQPQYFFPTYENDSLLFKLDDDNIDDGQPVKTPVIAEDAPVPSDSVLRDRTVLSGLRDS